MSYRFVSDLHTHTIASGHAYCTLREMAKAASDKGLELLGITEHAPQMPGSCQNFYFQNLKVVPREMYGIRLLLGCEANILDSEGHLDLSEKILQSMDVVIASLHIPCMKPGTRRENTDAYLAAMKNPYVNIIGHPDDGRYEVDYRALVEGAKEYGKVLEINNHSLQPNCTRQNAVVNDTCMLNLCREYGVPVIINSDAHFDTLIGEFDEAAALLESLDFPEELVLNRSVDALKGYINRDLWK
ncbi:MAG: phosphatase [Eubacteriales bacterium]|nr:phosphatase [Eubacteriales bacterium]